jgi:peptidoglycan endopeptidase LytE
MQIDGKRIVKVGIIAMMIMIALCAQASAATLKPGSRGTAVAALQKGLRSKGYYQYKSNPSGRYDSAVRKAVGVFQIANSIKPVNGYANDQLQEMIISEGEDVVLHAQYIEKLTDAQLKPGGSGSYVKKAQTRLRKLGYFTAKVDGRYRATTQTAVALFQTAHSLSATGIADAQTRTALYASEATTRAKYEAANFLTALRTGSKGTQVTQFQERLAEKGFYWSAPTGAFDAQTKYSVRMFQEANGLKTTGNVNSALRALANGASAVSFEEYTKQTHLLPMTTSTKPGAKVAVLQLRLTELGYYKGAISGAYSKAVATAVRNFQIYNNMKTVNGKANAETRALMNDPKALTYAQVNGSDTLKYKSTGDSVKKLQSRLKELGYYTGAVNGRYDNSVVAAIKRFQKYNGISQTGIAYSTTLAVLYGVNAVEHTHAKIEQLICVAMGKLDKPYQSGKRGPNAFDCSGFTSYCLKQVGISVTAEVQAQGRSKIGLGKKITDYKDLKRGDMVFFWSPDRKKKPGHAGIYLGSVGKQRQFIHASSSAKRVVVSDMNTNYYIGEDGAFLWGIRVWE